MKFLCRNPKDFFKISRDDEYSLREFPGKALIGVLFQKDEIYQQFLRHLETIEVEIELESEIYKFDSTDYYQEEMGSGLYRIFLSFKGLYPVEQFFCNVKTSHMRFCRPIRIWIPSASSSRKPITYG